MEASYKVIYTGEVQDGFNLIKVEDGFARLFKVSPEKASTFLIPNKIIKQDLTQARANTYKRQLEKIGMTIRIECEQPEFSFAKLEMAEQERSQPEISTTRKHEDSFATTFEGLSVVGLEDQFKPSVPMEQSTGLAQGQIECPKCKIVQDKADQCFNCGVYIQKVLNQIEQAKIDEQTHIAYQPYIKQEDLEVSEEVEEPTKFTSMPYIAAAMVALMGAIIWKLIAINVNYEIGWVAVIIGSSIALAASFFNKQGKDLSIICALLAACSIYGGKYLTAEADKDFAIIEMNEIISYIPEDALKEFHKQIIGESQEFVDMINNEAIFKSEIRSAVISQGYDPQTVPIDKIYKYLYKNVKPYFDAVVANPPEFYQWTTEFPVFLESLVRNFPTHSIVMFEFGWIDYLFLFLGVSSAFQISRKQI